MIRARRSSAARRRIFRSRRTSRSALLGVVALESSRAWLGGSRIGGTRCVMWALGVIVAWGGDNLLCLLGSVTSFEMDEKSSPLL